jgi:hypothetical protein
MFYCLICKIKLISGILITITNRVEVDEDCFDHFTEFYHSTKT